MVTAGEKLKAARLRNNLSLDDVSKLTKIKSVFLEYIEKGEYVKLPSISYAHGFVKNYALFLGLNDKEIMAVFRREVNPENAVKVLPKGFETEQSFNGKIRIRTTTLLMVCLIFLFFGFLIFQYRSAFLNPRLVIISPKDKSVINSSTLTIEGTTDPNVMVYVDKNEVSVDSRGNFSKTINVFPGPTTIIIRSINKFQRETQKKINLFIKNT